MPGSHSVERFVIEENLHCIIKTHWKERKTWWVADFSPLLLLITEFFNTSCLFLSVLVLHSC